MVSIVVAVAPAIHLDITGVSGLVLQDLHGVRTVFADDDDVLFGARVIFIEAVTCFAITVHVFAKPELKLDACLVAEPAHKVFEFAVEFLLKRPASRFALSLAVIHANMNATATNLSNDPPFSVALGPATAKPAHFTGILGGLGLCRHLISAFGVIGARLWRNGRPVGGVADIVAPGTPSKRNGCQGGLVCNLDALLGVNLLNSLALHEAAEELAVDTGGEVLNPLLGKAGLLVDSGHLLAHFLGATHIRLLEIVNWGQDVCIVLIWQGRVSLAYVFLASRQDGRGY